MVGIQKYTNTSDEYIKYNKYMVDYIKYMVKNGKTNGEIRTDKTTDELTLFIESNIEGIFFKWIVYENYNLKEETEINLKNMWEYIRKQ